MAKAKVPAKAGAKAADGAGGGPSMMSTVIAIVLVTLIGGGLGAFVGMKLSTPKAKPPGAEVAEAEALAEAAAADGHAAKADDGHAKPAADAAEQTVPAGAVIVDLKPIVTNLSSPEGTWLRVEAALIMHPDPELDRKKIAEQIGHDMLAYLRTVSMQQISGGSGFANLRNDLLDRAKTRSEGKVEDLVFRSVIVE